jgi:flagellar hook protein FlgE
VAAVAQQFKQGNIDFTGNSLDLAINGQGFFVLDDNGEQIYTRAGGFQVDRNGFVVNNQNQRLQVYPPVGDPQAGQFGTGALENLQLSTEESPPKETDTVNAQLNLDAAAQPPLEDPNDPASNVLDFDPADPNTYNYATSVTVYDSLGISHTSTLYFQKQDDNQWQAFLTVDGVFDDPDADPPELQIFPDGDNELTFNPDGTLDLDDPDDGILEIEIEADGLATGADALEFAVNLRELTQFGSPFTVSRLLQDGFTSGRLSNIDVDPSGVLFAQYTNGQSRALGQVAMAVFENQQGLRQLGSSWAESFTSGPPTFGQPDTGRFGAIEAGALEASTVELTEQLVNLITSQRNFQANAQVISAADTITQTVINIR